MSQQIHPLKEQLDKFIVSKTRSTWLYHDSIRVYVRNSRRYYKKKIVLAIDVANIIVPDKYQGKGLFKEFMKLVEKYVEDGVASIVFVENIHNEKLEAQLRKHGYVDYNYGYSQSLGVPSLIKERSHSSTG